MNDKRYQWILYIIVFVILGTITIQVYWNYKNYLVNKQQLINDVQISLDNAVEAYYANLTEHAYNFTFNEGTEEKYEENYFTKGDSIVKLFVKGDTLYDRMLQHINNIIRNDIDLDTINSNQHHDISVFKELREGLFVEMKNIIIDTQQIANTRLKGFLHIDSTSQRHFRTLTSKIIFSISQDSLNLKAIDTFLQKELLRKKLDISYGLSFNKINSNTIIHNSNIVNASALRTISISPFLPKESILTVHFNNETKIILKRILSGILISLLLVLVVISCLFYLLKIIKHQKQLAEVKNDLISNITHEFKTPIATISVALESIKNFNVIDDKEKTKTYLDMSNEQLNKLNIMVEKLLETATLDSGNLTLIKEKCNITELVKNIIEKHQIQTEAKTIHFNSSETITANVDVFHFENAINNIIDNAVKYGGKTISVELNKTKNGIEISISDNGNTIAKANKDKIFEKFYRIPKGNTHDVKGFGIGLYYAKKIIEKHNGTIDLNLDNKLTTFTISLPNE